MKKCPFCAEEIQSEAIKCRYCGSFLSAAPTGGGSSGPEPVGAGSRSGAPAGAEPSHPEGHRSRHRDEPPRRHYDEPPRRHYDDRRDGPFEDRRAEADPRRGERKILFAGSPSWRAFFREYFSIIVGAVVVPIVAHKIAMALEATTFTRVLSVGIPLGIAAIAFLAINIYRRSLVWRISTTNIESEHGIITKKIDVLELWRCRDVRYRQSILDRILQIAHIEIFTADVTTPQLQITGVPASRQLFEQIRDSIEIQRQSRNVFGVVQ